MAALILPIFPLPDVTLFPHALLPLHVFEARYRALVTDAVARDRQIAIVQLAPGWQADYAGKPPVSAVAGAGEIVSCERLPTGRFNILLKGLSRVRITRELPSDTLYRLVRAETLEDKAPSVDVAETVGRIRASCVRLLKALDRPPDLLDSALSEEQSPGALADRVAAVILPDAALRQELLETVDVTRRLDRLSTALAELINEVRGPE